MVQRGACHGRTCPDDTCQHLDSSSQFLFDQLALAQAGVETDKHDDREWADDHGLSAVPNNTRAPGW